MLIRKAKDYLEDYLRNEKENKILGFYSHFIITVFLRYELYKYF